MKILQIIADGNPGGGTTFVLELMDSLQNCVLLTQKDSHACRDYGLDFFTSRFDLRIPFKMQRIINEVKPDLIHVHGGRAAFFLSFCPKVCPIVYTIHGLHGIHKGSRLGKWGERRAIKGADVVTFVSHAEEELALEHNLLRGKDHCVIPHGIQLDKIPKKEKTIAKQLGYLGRLSPEKDPQFLLKIMDILGPKGYHLRVIGGGEIEMNHPHITVTGILPREQALRELSTVETLIVPSKWEAFGLVLLEAMALEIPIIAARIPPFEEIITSDKHGILIDRKDPLLYASIIESKKDYTQEAKKHLLENYTWDRCVNAYLALYNAVSYHLNS